MQSYNLSIISTFFKACSCIVSIHPLIKLVAYISSILSSSKYYFAFNLSKYLRV
jgi:hypothetical protein